MILTSLPSVESVVSAITPIIEATERYGNYGNVYPDPVSGLDIGYGVQLIGPSGVIDRQ